MSLLFSTSATSTGYEVSILDGDNLIVSCKWVPEGRSMARRKVLTICGKTVAKGTDLIEALDDAGFDQQVSEDISDIVDGLSDKLFDAMHIAQDASAAGSIVP